MRQPPLCLRPGRQRWQGRRGPIKPASPAPSRRSAALQRQRRQRDIEPRTAELHRHRRSARAQREGRDAIARSIQRDYLRRGLRPAWLDLERGVHADGISILSRSRHSRSGACARKRARDDRRRRQPRHRRWRHQRQLAGDLEQQQHAHAQRVQQRQHQRCDLGSKWRAGAQRGQCDQTGRRGECSDLHAAERQLEPGLMGYRPFGGEFPAPRGNVLRALGGNG